MNKTIKIILNLAIFLVIIGFAWFIIQSVNKEEITYADIPEEISSSSPYERVSSFELPHEIIRLETYNDKLFIISGQSVYISDTGGAQSASFHIKPDARDITVEQENIYILYPTFIEVYTADGSLTHEWEACSELSDYCSFTFAGGFIYVTDAENKNICKYTKEGNFVKFIQSPRGFIIPSYSFDIVSWNDTLYCTNSGRHLIESYTLDGDFIAAFGGPGSEPGAFAGCCNPVYISFTPNGELITSEKGNPRVSSFNRNGKFDKILLNSRLLGGGNKAYDIRAYDNKLFVAGKNRVTIYQYNK